MATTTYRVRANLALQRLLQEQGACVWPEVEARLAEPAGSARPIHPHILTGAKKYLLRGGRIIESEPTTTRGGREIVVYHAPIRLGDRRRIDDIAARKRLLHTRFLSWAKASKKHPRGLVGPAAEHVLYACYVRRMSLACIHSLGPKAVTSPIYSGSPYQAAPWTPRRSTWGSLVASRLAP